jgi:hypothetical protein
MRSHDQSLESYDRTVRVCHMVGFDISLCAQKKNIASSGSSYCQSYQAAFSGSIIPNISASLLSPWICVWFAQGLEDEVWLEGKVQFRVLSSN